MRVDPARSSRALRDVLRAMVLIGMAITGLRAPAAEGGKPIMALFRDGTVHVGRNVGDWQNLNGHPTLDDRRLFDESNPLRLLRDATRPIQLQPPYVEMANGDVLPGKIVSAVGANPEEGLPHRLIVHLASPLARAGDTETSELGILPSQVVRAVLRKEAQDVSAPGTLTFHDGRRVTVKSLRFRDDTVRALTADGSTTARLSELAEIHFPHRSENARFDALVADRTRPTRDAGTLIGRIVTTHGAVLTYHRSMRQFVKTSHGYDQVVQPLWSVEPIVVLEDDIAVRSYCRRDELPVSLLPSRALATRSYLSGLTAWRLNRNVRGGALAVGGLSSELGVGTRSYSEIAFDLPAAAREFSAWVGIDRSVGIGGCVQCRVYRDKVSGKPMWESGFLRGGEEPVRVDVRDLKGAKRLILVTDYGHKNRPTGADPIDIRDEVSWLLPYVQIELPLGTVFGGDLTRAIPQWSRWRIQSAEALSLRPSWNAKTQRWQPAVVPLKRENRKRTDALLRLGRKLDVTHANAWLEIAATHDKTGKMPHEITVRVNGAPVESMADGNLMTGDQEKHDVRHWSLAPYLGQTIKLVVTVHPKSDGDHESYGIVWNRLALSPIIEDLPSDGQPISPDVLLAEQTPESKKLSTKDRKLVPGKLTNDKPLSIGRLGFPGGIGLEGREQVTYRLDPAWRRFVAVIGLADGGQVTGPFEILLDGKPHWSTAVEGAEKTSSGVMDRNTPARQIDIAIPQGHKTITIKQSGRGTHFGGWGNAGFL